MLNETNYKLLTIVVTYNAMKWADRCFGSVESSKVKSDLFIVDNGSTDGTVDYIETHFPNAILFPSEENLKVSVHFSALPSE